MKILKIYWRVFLWAIIILIMSLMPPSDKKNIGYLIPHTDKIVHFGLYFLLAFLGILSYYLSFNKKTTIKNILIWALGCIAYGGLMEYLQKIATTNRNSDWFDFIANSFGVLFALALQEIWIKLYLKILKKITLKS